jgi:TetR/AcrR family transcriptional regulator, regulator of cefoperazone and chloramphenicol sensitivity
MEARSPTSARADAALIDAAIELFGRGGFEAVGTRALCERAGTNLAAIRYHFGGKDGLYRAAVQHVVDLLKPRLDLAVAAFAEGARLAGDDRARQAQLVITFVAAVLGIFLRNPDVKRIIPFVLREFFVPGPHFGIFYEALPRRLHELAAHIVCMVDGLDPDTDLAKIRAHALIGQIMVFNIGREILFRRTGWTDYTDEAVAAITREVQRMTLRALGLEAPAHEHT